MYGHIRFHRREKKTAIVRTNVNNDFDIIFIVLWKGGGGVDHAHGEESEGEIGEEFHDSRWLFGFEIY